MILATLKFQLDRINRNRGTFFLIVLTTLGVLYVGFKHGTNIQAVSYLAVMYLCSFFIDMYALRRPASNDFPVRNPKRESIYFFVSLFLALVFFFIRFFAFADWASVSGAVKFSFIPFLLFIFPIALAAILLMAKYTPKELGVRLQGIVVVVPIIILSAVVNRFITPESLTWNAVVEEGGGIAGALWSGFVLAGLSEEFYRVIGQTRLGAWMRNFGYGWFLTTVLWALMHAPKWYGESHDLTEALLGSLRIIPIGLMWGYITHRTKSILPAVIVHGTNVWGLQNF